MQLPENVPPESSNIVELFAGRKAIGARSALPRSDAPRDAGQAHRARSPPSGRATPSGHGSPVLGVVPLDEQLRALQAVVVRRAGLGRAGPGEVDRVEGRPGRRSGQRGHLRRDPTEIGAQQRAQQLALAVVELGSGYALRCWWCRRSPPGRRRTRPVAASMASLIVCSFACSTGSGNRRHAPDPTRGSSRSPSVTIVRFTVTTSDGRAGAGRLGSASSGCSDRTSSRARSST